jgi:hypothetical protein
MTDQSHPYNRPSDPAKRHSAALTDGPDRAAARGMLKAIGFSDEDLAKPIIGVGHSWIETMPCNYNHRRLAEAAKEGIRAAGGTPMEFNTISISDGVSMGTEGMKASLVSRELVADSVELVTRGHLFDGLVCIFGCDKTGPGSAMALARLDIPALALYSGTIYPGLRNGVRNATVVTIFEAIGAYRAGKISLDDLYEVESASCPGPGACGGQFTANTISMVMEFLGLSPAGLNEIPAEDPAKDDAARRAGEMLMRLVRDDLRPSTFVTRTSIDNAIASIAATGGSPTSTGSPSTSTTSGRSPIGRRSWPTSSPAAATPRRICTRRAGSPSSCASCWPAAGSTARRGTSTGGRSPRLPRRPIRPKDRTSSFRSSVRSRRPAAWRSCAARSLRTAASSRWQAMSDASTAARPASSTRRGSAMPPSATAGSCRAMSS